MDKIYHKAINKRIQKLSEDIGELKVRSEMEPIWSEPAPIGDREPIGSGISEKMGVYRIIYKPTMITMSIGKGWIGDRKCRHKLIHQNKGKPVRYSTSNTDSPTGRKMYNYDRKLKNWLFSWCEVGNEELALEYEKQLQFSEKPEFNDLNMAGK
tara:strand:- start:109 stop:570 length:462 start_codon:yes stop_codon:yes gene_type:complete